MRAAESGPVAQVLTVGMTYRDLVFIGLQEMPRPGRESYATAFHETWGGICNMTRVCRGLGMSVALATAIGDDDASDHLLRNMDEAGIDTSLTIRHPNWQLPVTVALSVPDDRAMLTVEHPPPTGIAAHLDHAPFRANSIIVDMRDPAMEWMKSARSRGSVIYASRGFDPTGAWRSESLADVDACDVWMLNEMEACAFSGKTDPVSAARALASRVPLIVVTRGAQGMVAVDASRGEEVEIAAFPITPQSTTGAGDSTLAAFVYTGQVSGISLRQRLHVAAFIAGSILERPAGAADPPSIAELVASIRYRTEPRLQMVTEILSSTIHA